MKFGKKMVVKRMKPYVNLVHKHSNHLERLLSNEKLTDAYNEERILLIRKLGYPIERKEFCMRGGGGVVRSVKATLPLEGKY